MQSLLLTEDSNSIPEWKSKHKLKHLVRPPPPPLPFIHHHKVQLVFALDVHVCHMAPVVS